MLLGSKNIEREHKCSLPLILGYVLVVLFAGAIHQQAGLQGHEIHLAVLEVQQIEALLGLLY